MSDEILMQLPLVPLRDMVVFPSMMAPFVVGRKASILALEATLATSDKRIFLATQRDPKIDDPSMDEIYHVGVVATVVQNLKLPNQNVKVMVEGLSRAEIVGSRESGGYVTVDAKAIDTVFRAIHEGDPDPKLLAYQYIQSLPAIANGDSNKIWVIPAELTAAMTLLSNGFQGKNADGTPATSPPPAAPKDEPPRVG